MDPLAIKQQTVEYYRKATAELNSDHAIQYREEHKAWASNVIAQKQAGTWEQVEAVYMQGKPKPALLMTLRVDYAIDQYCVIVSGPQTVVPELPLPDVPKPTPDQEITEFRGPVPGWPGYYWAGNSTGPAERRTIYEGHTFELMIIGELGTIIYQKIWAPVVG